MLYADDLVLLTDSEGELQSLLNVLHRWCKKWRLMLNLRKTKVVHFRTPRTKKTQYPFRYGYEEIEIASSYKYLGVTFDETLTFDKSIETLSRSPARALGAIISKVNNLRNISYNTFTKLYESCVFPIMTYGSAVWVYKCKSELDKIQNRAQRYFMGVHKYAPNLAMMCNMG